MSNENQYIEAAKIAAETASRNAHNTMIIAFASAFIALGGVVLTAWITYKNASRSTVIDALTKQRIEWLHTLRENFVDFNNLAQQIFFEMNRIEAGDIFEKYYLLEKSKNNIRLLLNPKESFTRSLNDSSDKLLDVLIGSKSGIDGEVLQLLLDSIYFNQQTILKSEWRRIKEEIKKGRELKPEEVSLIYHQTSIENEEFRKNTKKKDNF